MVTAANRVWFTSSHGRILHAAKRDEVPGILIAYCGRRVASEFVRTFEPSLNGSHLFVCRRCYDGAIRDDGSIR